jgi:hypothetical protein
MAGNAAHAKNRGSNPRSTEDDHRLRSKKFIQTLDPAAAAAARALRRD